MDLRSDTVTVPTPEMRRIMANAPVGDDVYGEDPSVNELQEYIAELLGKEAALYVPSGSMGNQICIAINTQTGDEVIAEADAHIFYYETAAPSVISRVQVRTIPSERGEMDIQRVLNAIRPKDYYFPRTAMIAVENTHNRHGGAIISLDYIKELRKVVDENNLQFHCDGARLWNACAATGISPKGYIEPFDTVSVCLSKALGAPVGSVIAGSREKIEKALKWRKILGGGMRQAGILASAGLYAVKEHFKLLPKDHEHALLFAQAISESEYIEVDLKRVETNMVVFGFPSQIDTDTFVSECKKRGLLISSVGKSTIRAVFHFQVSEVEAKEAAEIVIDVINIEMKKN